jgi:hypothetical protein
MRLASWGWERDQQQESQKLKPDLEEISQNGTKSNG